MSAISSVRRLNKMSNLLDHPVIRDLLRAIKLQQAQLPTKSKLPAWNLSFVLHALTKPPFESINNSSLVHLSWKTNFLLLLASGWEEGRFVSRCIMDFLDTEDKSKGEFGNALPHSGGFTEGFGLRRRST